MKYAVILFLVSFFLFGCYSFTEDLKNPETPAEIGLNPGNEAPEIIMNDVNGNPIKLSDLRGQMVLIDFWASWCGPCRRENPNVVRVYDKYKNSEFTNGSGFTVFSVSLDTKQANWEAAIKQDNLSWPNHVSDLRGWSNAAAQQYKVNSIPSSLLIDGDGIILSKNQRDVALEPSISKHLK